jgi:multiple sugar transport system permease protein
VLVPTDDVTDTGETVAWTASSDRSSPPRSRASSRRWSGLRSAVGAVFRDPADPEFSVVRNVSDAVPVKELTAQPSNYRRVLDLQRLDRSLTNTLLVTVLVVVGQVVTSILGGYAFSRMQFAGRDALFLGYIGSVMIPFVVLIIPLYQLMVAIGWVDSLVALVVPFIFSPTAPSSCGSSSSRSPRSSRRRPSWTAPAAGRSCGRSSSAVGAGDRDAVHLRLPVRLELLRLAAGRHQLRQPGQPGAGPVAAGARRSGGRHARTWCSAGVVIALLPPITVFVLAQRYFVENVASTGLKG